VNGQGSGDVGPVEVGANKPEHVGLAVAQRLDESGRLDRPVLRPRRRSQ
jgi:hypothetical protein